MCTVQLPGRENRFRETPFTSLAELADVLATVVQSYQAHDDLPFAFFGHSLGAIVAFETVRRLRRAAGTLPVALFASASRAPQLPWPHPPVRMLNDLELLAEVHRRYGSVPAVVLDDAELRDFFTPALRADMTLIETYQYEDEAPFGFPIVAFGGDTDRMVERNAVESWAVQTSGAFDSRMLSGDHLFLQSQRGALLDAIATILGRRHIHAATSAPSVG